MMEKWRASASLNKIRITVNNPPVTFIPVDFLNTPLTNMSRIKGKIIFRCSQKQRNNCGSLLYITRLIFILIIVRTHLLIKRKNRKSIRFSINRRRFVWKKK